HARGNVSQGIPIREIEIDWSKPWARKHWQTLQQSYGRAPYFSLYSREVEKLYRRQFCLLADFTIEVTIALSRMLGIHKTKFVRASSLHVTGEKTVRLLAILKALGCTHYVSGPRAKAYLDEKMLEDAGITLEYMTYDYPEYPQVSAPFDPF